jgi:hypothetical protein
MYIVSTFGGGLKVLVGTEQLANAVAEAWENLDQLPTTIHKETPHESYLRVTKRPYWRVKR